MRRFIRFFLWGALTVVILTAAGAYLLYQASQEVPDFYEKAVVVELPQAEQQVTGEIFEKQVLELHNDARHDGFWEASFTDEQINAWLAVDLPRRFGNELPPQISQPRVEITADEFRLGFRYESEDLSTVISVAADAYLTETPNEVALRIRRVRAGSLPLPLKRFLGMVSKGAREAGILLRWANEKNDPVALLQMPMEDQDLAGKSVHLQALELRDHEIYLAGQTGDGDGDEPAEVAARDLRDGPIGE